MVIDLNKNIDLITWKKERLVIGFFDGLHHGHLALFGDKVASTSVLTFVNIPSKKNLLYSNKERVSQLKKLGVKNIYVYDVKENLSSNEFFNKYLDILDPEEIIVGSDFHLGSDHVSIDEIKKRYNLTVVERLPDYSSTRIRDAILNANFEDANKMLIWPYYRKGVVQQNKKMGKEIGFPTANIPIADELIKIPFGVYATKTILFGERYKSASMVGKPLTINQKTLASIETHLIDYDNEDFYGEEIKVIFYSYIGNVKNVISKSALIKRVKKFIEIASNYNWIKSS